MKNLFLLFFVLIITSGCGEASVLSFSSEEFTETQLAICETEACSSIAINFVRAEGDSEVSEKINQSINTFLIQSLFLGEDDNPQANNVEDAAEDFILAYRDHQPDLPGNLDFGGYEADISIQITFQDENLISLEATRYLFTGGAHGYGGISFLNFNSSSGDFLNNNTLFTDDKTFVSFAELKFKEAFEIPLEDTINSTGYWFENDTFSLPEAIGFDHNGIILVYNPYEIASYAHGPITLKVSWEEVIPFLNITLL